jgi:tetratricopeptide (TPR) repeat protein
LKNDSYFQLWRRKIAAHLLKDLYTMQLDTLEQKLLSALAVYRKPVSLDAAEAVLDSASTKTEILAALDVLLTQHLLRPSGGDYKLHPIVAHYLRHDLEETDEQSNYRPSQDTHIKAANHCLRRAIETCPPHGQREDIRDVQFLVEAVWHLCQGQKWQEAYELMRDENIFADLRRWRENTTLLDLYQLLLPLNKWHPQDAQEADIYGKLGEIHTEMVNAHSNHADEALQYFKRSFTLYSQIEDYKGKCSILRDIGKLHLKQNQIEVALAFFMEVEKLLKEAQSSGGEEVDPWKEELRRQVGEERYNILLREIEPLGKQIVKQILS